MSDLHTEVLDERTAAVLGGVGRTRELASFYLAGGTGLALQLGHRRSLDLDLFSERPWSWEALARPIQALGPVEVERQEEGTFVGSVGGVRFSLFHYPYVLLEPVIESSYGVALAGLLDIACMKLVAMAQRGSRKDFVDLYFLGMSGVTPRSALNALGRKVAGVSYNPVHIARSLAFFEDAEAEPMPQMVMDCDWEDVRRYCVFEARSLLAEIGVPGL